MALVGRDDERTTLAARELEIEVHFNNGDPTISGGRNYQLNLVKSPLVCFVDDDVTVHGDAFLTIEDAMQGIPAGLFGLRSYREDTDELFLYYGAADTRVGLATANRADVLAYLLECPPG